MCHSYFSRVCDFHLQRSSDAHPVYFVCLLALKGFLMLHQCYLCDILTILQLVCVFGVPMVRHISVLNSFWATACSVDQCCEDVVKLLDLNALFLMVLLMWSVLIVVDEILLLDLCCNRVFRNVHYFIIMGFAGKVYVHQFTCTISVN